MRGIKRILLLELGALALALGAVVLVLVHPGEGEGWGGFFLLLFLLYFVLPGLGILVAATGSVFLFRQLRGRARVPGRWRTVGVVLLVVNAGILLGGAAVYGRHTFAGEFDVFARHYIDVLRPNAERLLTPHGVAQVVRKEARRRHFRVLDVWVSAGVEGNQWPRGVPGECRPKHASHFLQEHVGEPHPYCLSHFDPSLCLPRIVCLRSRSGSNRVADLWHFRPVASY